jgi:hypothetical protein
MRAMDRVDVEFMLVADAAQSFGGKVHLLGGGWTHLFLPDSDSRPLAFSVVVGITIPWNVTNQRFRFALELRDADGDLVDEIFPPREFEQGRPPGLRPGADQRVILAIPASPDFPALGRYIFHAILDGEDRARSAIEVVGEPADPN